MGIGIEDVFDVGLAVGDIKGLDFGHGNEQANHGLISVDIGHGFSWVSGIRMDAKLFVNKTFDAGL